MDDVEQIVYATENMAPTSEPREHMKSDPPYQPRKNIVRVELAADVKVSLANLKRNFYTTSSCGICGKASLLALQTFCSPRIKNSFSINADIIYALPSRLREAQSVFNRTGGLQGAGLFNAEGELLGIRDTTR
jgi:FdhD protein